MLSQASCNNNAASCTFGHTFFCSSGGLPTCEISNIPTCKRGNEFFGGICKLSIPSCVLNIPKCSFDNDFICSPGSIPSCEFLGLPLCKTRNTFTTGSCIDPRALLVDTLSFLDITSTPKLPPIIQLPLTTDESVGKVGIAYPGSNPSFEIKTPFKISQEEILSADIKDSRGIVLNGINFKLATIPNVSGRSVLTLTLPDDISKGESIFTLNLQANRVLKGRLQIVDFKELQIITIKNKNRKQILKPVIRRIFVSKENKKIRLNVKGNHFVSRQIIINENGTEKTLVNAEIPSPNTSVTIYPTDLKIRPTRTAVKARGRTISINFLLPDNVRIGTKATLVLATPRGIVSASFVIRPTTSNKR